MSEKENGQLPNIGALEKRRVIMADGQRYLIYYTFGNRRTVTDSAEDKLPESQAQNFTTEEKINV